MNFYDDPLVAKQLFPFTLTRSAADIRIGITTIREKWMAVNYPGQEPIPSHLLPTPATQAAINAKQPVQFQSGLSIEFPWHIFQHNDQVLKNDFAVITTGRTSQPIASSNSVIAPENIFLRSEERRVGKESKIWWSQK